MSTTRFAAAVLAIFWLQGCDIAPVEAAPAGGTPFVGVPIGPMPGPGKLPELAKNPYGQEEVVLQEGRKLFVWYNCAGCHGGHAGGGMGPSLRDKVWLYGSSEAHIYSSISQGRRQGMPAWGLKLPEDDVWKLVSYIKSLRTSKEPDAPNVAPPKATIPEGPAPERSEPHAGHH